MAPLLPPSSSSAAAETLRDRGRDLPAHPDRAGCGHERDARVLDQLLSSHAVSQHQLVDTGGRPDVLDGRASRVSTARAERRVASAGFQTTVSPATSASAAFQAKTATGKLNAEMIPTTPSGCHVSARRCPGRSEGMVLPYSWRDWPDGEVGDVDHLLHLAQGLGTDLADLGGDQRRDVLLVLGQQLSPALDHGAADRCGDVSPGFERLGGGGDSCLDVLVGVDPGGEDDFTGDGCPGFARTGEQGRVHPDGLQALVDFSGDFGGRRRAGAMVVMVPSFGLDLQSWDGRSVMVMPRVRSGSAQGCGLLGGIQFVGSRILRPAPRTAGRCRTGCRSGRRRGSPRRSGSTGRSRRPNAAGNPRRRWAREPGLRSRRGSAGTPSVSGAPGRVGHAVGEVGRGPGGPVPVRCVAGSSARPVRQPPTRGVPAGLEASQRIHLGHHAVVEVPAGFGEGDSALFDLTEADPQRPGRTSPSACRKDPPQRGRGRTSAAAGCPALPSWAAPGSRRSS